MGRGEGRVSEEGRGKKEEIWKNGRMKSRGKGGKEEEKVRKRRKCRSPQGSEGGPMGRGTGASKRLQNGLKLSFRNPSRSPHPVQIRSTSCPMGMGVKKVWLSIPLTGGQHVSRSRFSSVLRPINRNVGDWYHLRRSAVQPIQREPLPFRHRICRCSQADLNGRV
jgi:hypothetical protein